MLELPFSYWYSYSSGPSGKLLRFVVLFSCRVAVATGREFNWSPLVAALPAVGFKSGINFLVAAVGDGAERLALGGYAGCDAYARSGVAGSACLFIEVLGGFKVAIGFRD